MQFERCGATLVPRGSLSCEIVLSSFSAMHHFSSKDLENKTRLLTENTISVYCNEKTPSGVSASPGR